MTNADLRGKPDAGNPHVAPAPGYGGTGRLGEGEVAPAKPRRGSLLGKPCLRLVAATVVLTAAQAFGARENFDFGWAFARKDFPFHFAKTGLSSSPVENANNNGNATVAADASGWTQVDLPHDWALSCGVFQKGTLNGFRAVGLGFPQDSVGWYRKWFAMPAAHRGKRLFLNFEGVCRDARFWVNGCYLGRNDSAYVGCRFEITDVLRYGATNNFVTVRVQADRGEGWWYDGAGIYRHVWLETLDADGPVPDSVFIRLKELKDGVATMRVDYETFTGGKAGYDFAVANPRLWSLEDPYLYTLELKGETFTYGIRTIRFDPEKGFFLNGRHVPVNGVCCHQDFAGVGVAVPTALQDYRVRRLKWFGANAIRTSHNPPNPDLLDACDRLGMLVLDETRLFSASHEGLGQFARFVRRDRNHPSVIAWSIGNEEHNVQNGEIGRQMALAFKRVARELDPTRPISYGGNNGTHHAGGVNEIVDVRGINYIRLMGREGRDLDAYHADHPTVPVWGSEEASTFATRGCERSLDNIVLMRDSDEAENAHHAWTKTAEGWTTEYAKRPWLAGAFVWTGFDYRGESRWPALVNNFGVLDLCGYAKNNAHYYRARWTNEDVLHLYPNWNLPRTNLWVNTNCDTVELFVNGVSVGRKTRAADAFRLSFPVTYAPGAVEARGLRNGRVVTDRLETTGRFSVIRAEADRTTLAADGADATVVNVTACDAAGREVPDACGLALFDIEGPGRILGVGNGDPLSHEDDICPADRWRRRFFNGKCQVIVGVLREKGTIRLAIRGETAQAVTVEIKAK